MTFRRGAALIAALVLLFAVCTVTTAGGVEEQAVFSRVNRVDADFGRSPYLRWEASTGQSFAQPCVSGDIVVVGNDSGTLFAFDRLTGLESWRYDTEPRSRIRMTPLVYDRLCLFGTVDGYLYALDAGTGALRWKTPVSGWVTGSPVVSGDTIYVGCYQGKVHAVGLDGRDIWSVGTDGEFVSAPLALTPHGLAVGSMSGSVLLLDPKAGTVLWKQATDGHISGVAYDSARDAVIAASVGPKTGGIYSLRGSSGDVMWRYRSRSNNYWSAPALSQDFAVAGNLGCLEAVNLNDGSGLWVLAAQPEKVRGKGFNRTFYPSIKTPLIARNAIFAVGSFEVDAPSRMMCVSPAGELLNSWLLTADPSCPPVGSSDGLYQVTSTGVLEAWSDVRMVIAGKRVVFGDAPAVLCEGSSMVPVRTIADHSGGTVTWNAETSSLALSIGNQQVTMVVNCGEATVNGDSCPVTPAPRILWGRAYVPVRFIAEKILGARVSWDPATLTISLVP